jgi:hypothetical protein
MMVAGFVLEMFFGWLVGVFLFMGLQNKSSLRTKKHKNTPKHDPGQSLERTLPGIPGIVLLSDATTGVRHDYIHKGIR